MMSFRCVRHSAVTSAKYRHLILGAVSILKQTSTLLPWLPRQNWSPGQTLDQHK